MGTIIRLRNWLLLCAGVVLILTGCAHTTPFKDDYYFRALGRPSEMVVTMNLDNSRELYEEVAKQQDTASIDAIVTRSDRISVSIDTPSEGSDEPRYYGGVEGNFGYLTANTALLVSKDWKRQEKDSVAYFGNDNTDLKVTIPKNGIVIFSNDDIKDVYMKTYKERELFIPYKISQKMGEGLFGMYLESPDDIMYVTDEFPRTMLLSIDSVWLVVTGQKDDYRVTGMVETKNRQASRVFGTLLKMNYLMRIRAMENPIGQWQDDIQIDDQDIMIENMYIDNEMVMGLFSKILTNL